MTTDYTREKTDWLKSRSNNKLTGQYLASESRTLRKLQNAHRDGRNNLKSVLRNTSKETHFNSINGKLNLACERKTETRKFKQLGDRLFVLATSQ